jgi:hypothetical protein
MRVSDEFLEIHRQMARQTGRQAIPGRGHPPAGRDRAEGEGEMKVPTSKPTKLNRYIEWLSRGSRTGRVAYALRASNLPKTSPGAEWQLDSKFNAAEELLRDPSLKDVIKAAIDKGVKVVTWD